MQTRIELDALNAQVMFYKKMSKIELRDLFAMAAMNGILARGKADAFDVEARAYTYADRMMQARSQTKSDEK